MVFCAPWADSSFHNWINQQNLVSGNQMQNNFGVLTQWEFLSLGPKLIYKNENLKNLGWLTWIQSIYWWLQVNHKNCHPHHDLPKTYRGIKAVCTVWIRPTENFITHPRYNGSINEHWSYKCEQTAQQSTMQIWNLKLQIKIFDK